MTSVFSCVRRAVLVAYMSLTMHTLLCMALAFSRFVAEARRVVLLRRLARSRNTYRGALTKAVGGVPLLCSMNAFASYYESCTSVSDIHQTSEL